MNQDLVFWRDSEGDRLRRWYPDLITKGEVSMKFNLNLTF